jgi:protein-disulfide isomerase
MSSPGAPPSVGRVAHNHTVQSPRPRPHGKKRAPAPASPAATGWLTPRRLLAIVAAGAVVLAGILIGVSVAGSGGGKASSSSITGAAATQALFRGIPQQGLTLGSPTAPVRLVEYGDLQCPICREFAVVTLPTIVREYVRTGQVQLEFRGLTFLGSDSDKALRAAIAAGVQGKGWNMVDLLYRNQGQENSGWATDSKLQAAATAIPGLFVGDWLDDRNTTATERRIATMRAQAVSLMGSQFRTPTFAAGKRGQPLRYLPISSLDPGAFTPALDQLLSG